MVSDRKAAKGSVVKKEVDDPELEEALSAATKHQLELKKEDNRHREQMHAQDIGVFGWAFGGEKSAPVYIAAIATLFGLAGAAFCWFQASGVQEVASIDFWSTKAERAIAFSGATLAYIFGRGGKA